MNDRLTEKILSEARASLDPTEGDRRRMNRKILGAIGAAAVTTTATAGAAKTTGWLATGLGLPTGVVTVVKITAGGLLMSGVIVLGIVGGMAFYSNSEGKNATNKAAMQAPQDRTDSVAPQVDAGQNDILTKPGSATEDDAMGVGDEKNFENGSSPETKEMARSKGILPTSQMRAARINDPTVDSAKGVRQRNDDALLQEIALIKSASQALHGKNYSTAIQLLHEYTEKHPSGTMRQERDGLYIKALCNSGQIAAARSADKTFRRRYNKTPLMFGIKKQCSSQ